MDDQRKLEELVAAVAESAKYRAVSEQLIRTVGRRELVARRNLKEAIKATKNKLHQVAGAYMDTPRYDAWLAQLTDAAQTEQDASNLQAACLDVMRHHASTRERLPILGRIYREALAGLPPIRSVLDLACGLNPLARAWMPLESDATYYACDLYADMVAFLNGWFALGGPGQAFVCDLSAGAPAQKADLALALKLLPPLEQIERGAGLRLLRSIDAPFVLVSFPAHSLGGRGKGMAENYERQFDEMVGGEGWAITRFVFPGELAFLVRK